MILDNLEFHNTVALETVSGGGLAIRRYPETVRNSLCQLGRLVSQESAGCELRFVTEAPNFRLAVSSLPSGLAPYELHNQDLFIFKGDFFHSHYRLEPGKINHIMVTDIVGDVANGFAALKPGVKDSGYFKHQVWRVLFGRYPAIFHALDTYGYPVRPPQADELPNRRILFYGSSITNGASPTLYHLSYIQQTARHLKADCLNQGLSGACLCQPEVADYLAERDDWDMICLELGVNMRGAFTPEEFAERSRYLVKKITAANPDKPVFLITIFPNAESPQHAVGSSEMQNKQLAFDRILRDLIPELNHKQLYLVEGSDVLTDYSGITKDLIHPGDYGHMEMGRNLAEIIRENVQERSNA
jgi:lysophospholipase L1-like esterase